MPLLSQLTGVGQYTHELAKQFTTPLGIETEFYPPIVSSNQTGGEGDGPTPPRLLSLAKKCVAKSMLLRRAAKQLFALNALVSRRTFDIYFEPNFIPTIPYKYKKNVITVHDFSFDKFTEWHPQSRVDYFKKVFWDGAAKADAIITVSEFIKKEAVEEYGLDHQKIFPIHNGINHLTFSKFSSEGLAKFKEKTNLPEHFILFVGSLEPRKNITTLISAHSLLPDHIRREFPLVIAGGGGWLNDNIQNLIDQDKNILSLGYVDQSFLVGLYNCATCFVYIPWYEGFGLPPIEAMACGCPCIVSSVASIPEVCGDAVIYADPSDANQISFRLLSLIEDNKLQEALSREGIVHSSQFTWEKSASKHKDVFLSLIN